MFDNLINKNLYIQEFVDPETKKHYLFHVYFSIANVGHLEGYHVAECYITDTDPEHGVLVKYGQAAFPPEEFKEEDKDHILDELILGRLSYGIKRFEAIMSQGISGNELEP